MGLLLLGVLAQIHTATSLLLPAAEPVANGGEDRLARASTAGSPPSLQPVLAPQAEEQEDMGIAVPRDVIAMAQTHGDGRERGTGEGDPRAAGEEGSGLTAGTRKGKRKVVAPLAETHGDDHFQARNKRTISDQARPTEAADSEGAAGKKMQRELRDKKKKRKKGDEFDDLFSSLL